MIEHDNLHRTYARVADFRHFDPGQRIWWIYLRAAVEQWLERNDDPEIRIAYDRLKSFPENLLNERESWLTLRAAVAQLLARLLRRDSGGGNPHGLEQSHAALVGEHGGKISRRDQQKERARQFRLV